MKNCAPRPSISRLGSEVCAVINRVRRSFGPISMRGLAGLPQVRHLPLQPSARLNDWLNAADIHLLPQKAEAADLVLPSKLLGILASGRPLVASSPAGSELASFAEQAGACVPPGDPTAFAKALRALITDPERRADAGRRARLLAEEHFSQDIVLGRFEQQLQALVADRSKIR